MTNILGLVLACTLVFWLVLALAALGGLSAVASYGTAFGTAVLIGLILLLVQKNKRG